MADLAPKLSEDLERFANELELAGFDGFEWTQEGVARLSSAMAHTFRMFALDARWLEAKLDAADAVVAAMSSNRAFANRIDALKDGLVTGKVRILRPVRIDAEPARDGDVQ